jgi:hypothetical protein
VTGADGLRRRVRRGGFASEPAAIRARDAAVGQPSPRVLAQAWTVEKWLIGWLERLDLRPSTLSGYAAIVLGHLIPALGSHRLSEIETSDVQRAMDTVAREPPGAACWPPRPSPASWPCCAAGHQGARGSVRTPFKQRRFRRKLSRRQKAVNRARGERAIAALKTSKILAKPRCCPRRATTIVQAILVLHHVQADRYAG